MSVIRLVDELTLRAVIDRGHGLTFECDNCWRLVAADVLTLVGKLGPEATVGEVRRKLVCTRCHRRRARALLRTGNRTTATGSRRARAADAETISTR